MPGVSLILSHVCARFHISDSHKRFALASTDSYRINV